MLIINLLQRFLFGCGSAVKSLAFTSVVRPHIEYYIANFVCEVLICANYARCHGLHILIQQFNTFNSAIVLGVSQLCALLYLIWSKCRYLVSHQSSSLNWTAKDFDDSTALQSIFCNKSLPSYISLWRCDHR